MSRTFILIILILAIPQVFLKGIFQLNLSKATKIVRRMTIQQKIGQMISADMKSLQDLESGSINPLNAEQYFLGSIMVNSQSLPTDDGNLSETQNDPFSLSSSKRSTKSNWKLLLKRFKDVNLRIKVGNKKYDIQPLLSLTASHGNQNTLGSTIFPHNIGLSCSHNPDNFENVGFWTAQSINQLGFNHAFSPSVSTSHNMQWGRFYQTLGENTKMIQQYSRKYVKGLQQIRNNRIQGVLSTLKNYIGGSATIDGKDQGDVKVYNFNKFFQHNSAGFKGGIQSNAGSVMASSSSINLIPTSVNSELLIGNLRQQLNFKGFIISNYDEIMKNQKSMMNWNQQKAIVTMINSGIDMFLVSNKDSFINIIKTVQKMIQKKRLLEVRVDEAVIRIISVKIAMGLVKRQEESQAQEQNQIIELKINNFSKWLPESSKGSAYLDSLQAVRQSLVLLKNTNKVIPLKKQKIQNIILLGQQIIYTQRFNKIKLYRNFDNIGMQCGGQTLRQQGWMGNQLWSRYKKENNASSILDAIRILSKNNNNVKLLYPHYKDFTDLESIQETRKVFIQSIIDQGKNITAQNTVIIATFGQRPYAGAQGDINTPQCQQKPTQKCKYDPSLNSYGSPTQPKTLNLQMEFDQELLKAINHSVPVISILLTGRPMIAQNILIKSDAVIAAWLPGTSGGHGIVDAISGSYNLKPSTSSNSNSLSFNWPADMKSLQNYPVYGYDGKVPEIENKLFEIGYGLSTQPYQSQTLKDTLHLKNEKVDFYSKIFIALYIGLLGIYFMLNCKGQRKVFQEIHNEDAEE